MINVTTSRFSLIKRWGDISLKNFVNITQNFIESTSLVWKNKTIEINLLSKPPCCITYLQEEFIDFLAKQKKELIFATYDDPTKVLAHEYKNAQFIEVIINDMNKSTSGCVWIEFKRWLPNHAIFYMQPCAAKDIVYPYFLNKSKFNFFHRIGNGMEENHLHVPNR